MIVTAWKTGSPDDKTGAGYGIRISRSDREKYFKKEWESVILELEGDYKVKANLSPAFWRNCIELRKMEIGKWLINKGLAPWIKYNPPKLKLTPIRNREFKLSEI